MGKPRLMKPTRVDSAPATVSTRTSRPQLVRLDGLNSKVTMISSCFPCTSSRAILHAYHNHSMETIFVLGSTAQRNVLLACRIPNTKGLELNHGLNLEVQSCTKLRYKGVICHADHQHRGSQSEAASACSPSWFQSDRCVLNQACRRPSQRESETITCC